VRTSSVVFPALPALAATLALLVEGPATALAEWGPVPIRETAQKIRPIESCPDGHGGAFVAWQEESSYQ
jgi:hypothetical protein